MTTKYRTIGPNTDCRLCGVQFGYEQVRGEPSPRFCEGCATATPERRLLLEVVRRAVAELERSNDHTDSDIYFLRRDRVREAEAALRDYDRSHP